MSEEPQTPPLRLKPRIPAAGAPPAPVTEAPAPAAAPPSGEGVARLRIKPRLTLDPASTQQPQPASAAPAGDDPPSAPSPPVAPASPANQTPVEAEVPRIKLKPRAVPESAAPPAPRPAPVAVSPRPPAPPPAPAESVPPPPPVVVPPPPVVAEAPVEEVPASDGAKFKLKPKSAPSPAVGATTEQPPAETPPPLPPLTPPPVVLAADAPMPAAVASGEPALPPPPAPAFPPPPSSKKGKRSLKAPRAPMAKRTKLMALGLGVVTLGAAGFFGYTLLLDSAPPPPVLNRPIAQKAAPPPPALTPEADAASAAGKMIEKAQQALAVRAANAPEMEAAVSDVAPVGAAPAAATPAPSSTEVTPAASAPVEVAPEPEPEVEPTAAFKRFVLEMRVNGVFQGEPPRALINGRTVRPGEFLDNGLGIVFHGIDPEKKLILMRDANGARMTRKY